MQLIHKSGQCPNGWNDDSEICYKYEHDKENYFGALRHCKNMQDHHANVRQDFEEDESLLITMGKLIRLLHQRDFHHSIRINAVKYAGDWYEIFEAQYLKDKQCDIMNNISKKILFSRALFFE